jgi:hypothetical protein
MGHGRDDIIWTMLSRELGPAEIRDIQEFLRGESEHFDMGFGALVIEPYDNWSSRSSMFRIRHEQLGDETISRSALSSVLHDLLHFYRREQSIASRNDLN